jgi:quinohemoprotein ethanol dehydrogenase
MVMDGGVLSTAGGLVLAGREDGEFVVYDATTGKILKKFLTGSAIMAAPMSYSVGGKQYIAVLCGHGGGILDYLGTAAMKYRNEDRVVTFVLDGAPNVPKPPVREIAPIPTPPARYGSPELLTKGQDLFTEHCGRCHALGVPGVAPDLTRAPVIDSEDAFEAVVLRGALIPAGMARFDDVLDGRDTRALRAYLVDQAWQAYEAQGHAGSSGAH